jgi:hypothetical protein
MGDGFTILHRFVNILHCIAINGHGSASKNIPTGMAGATNISCMAVPQRGK